MCVKALEPPETGRCDATETRARDVTNRIDTFPGPATVAEFLCFYFFSRLCFIFLSKKKILDRDRPGISPALPGSRRNTSAERARQRHFARIANHLELGNRKRTILPSQNPSFHLSSPNPTAVNGPAVPRRKPSFYVFVLLSFSDTLSPHLHQPERMNACIAYTHYRRKDRDQSP